MHHSRDSSRRALAVTCYLDESGTDQRSPIAVVGGQLFNERLFVEFESAWQALLEIHRVEPPLHMKEFARPHGRFASLPDKQRRLLFEDVALAINRHKIYSLAVIVNQSEFFEFFSLESYKHLLGPYGLAFATCCLLNYQIAQHQQQDSLRIAYLLDTGNSQKQHVVDAHNMLSDFQKQRVSMHLGRLTFENDTTNASLQAADVIAWAARKKAERGSLGAGFEPLENVLQNYPTGAGQIPHFTYPVPRRWIKNLATGLDEWLAGGRIGKQHLDAFRKLIMPPY